MANQAPQGYPPSTGTMPGYDGIAVSPSDAVELSPAVRALYIGVAGNVKLKTIGGTTLEFIGIQAGTILPIQTKLVFNTSTTATNIIGIW